MDILIKQALVLIGGQASRLKQGGVDVPISKSFLPVLGKPLLFWNLCALYEAGIRSLILSGNETRQLYRAQQILRSLPYCFDSIIYFQDFGLGAHGLPYIARGLLHREFVFECGHSISTPEHYRRLIKAKSSKNVVFSAFQSHPGNVRQPVIINSLTAHISSSMTPTGMALAHPIVADSSYVRTLVDCDFDIVKILHYHTKHNLIRCIKSNMPPEFDIAEEMQAAQRIYEQYLAKAAIIRR